MSKWKQYRAEQTIAHQPAREPAPATRPQPKPPSLRLSQAAFFGLLLLVGFLATIAATSLSLGPFGPALVCSAWATWLVYAVSLFGMDLILLVIETKTRRDINRDGRIGRDRVQRPILYKPWKQPKATERDVPEPIVDSAAAIIILEPSTREIRAHELWSFLTEAYNTGKWTRRHWVSQGIPKSYWSDIRAFILRHQPDVWETDHRPTLDAFLARWGYPPTGPDQPGPDRTAGSE